MKIYDWNKEKNGLLKLERSISFENIILSIQEWKMLDEINHPNEEKYPTQKLFIVEFEKYAYIVPYVKEWDYFFLKTIIPSRKATKKYLIK